MNNETIKYFGDLASTNKEMEVFFKKFIEFNRNKENNKSFSFKTEDYYQMNLQEKYMTDEDSKNLIFDNKCCSIRRKVNFSVKEKELNSINVYLPLEKNGIDAKICLTSKDANSFMKEYEECSVLGSADISYSPTLKCFFLSNLIIYRHLEPIKKWTDILKGKNLSDRFDIFLKILGLNPEKLLYHEKIIALARLIPLVVKKYLLVDVSKKELGKTHTYTSLGFDPYTLVATRANLIVDGRNKKGGDFFQSKNAFIIDELSKIKDPEVITALQVYMNGDKYKGKITINNGNKKETDTSVIILGNANIKIDFLRLFIDQKQLLENTIIMNSSDGEAFISRITGLLNSWGCRTFSSAMKSTEENSLYNQSLLKEFLAEIRDKEFDIKPFQEILNIQEKSPSIRTQEAIEKTFEGFVKILFPEFISNPSYQQIRERKNEFLFFYNRAVEFRKTVDNQLKIMNPSSNNIETTPSLHSSTKNIMFNPNETCIFTPHRLFIIKSEEIEKLALDCMGIELNKKEAEVLKKKEVFYTLAEKKLVHAKKYTRFTIQNVNRTNQENNNIPNFNIGIWGDNSSNYNIGTWGNNSSNYNIGTWGDNSSNYNIGTWGDNSSNYNIGTWGDNSSNYNIGTWRNNSNCNTHNYSLNACYFPQPPSDLNFNFLTGEFEIFDKESEKIIIDYSFYDLI